MTEAGMRGPAGPDGGGLGRAPTGCFGGLFPKTEPLPGSLHLEWRRCGKAGCRCADGQPHGPYFYRYWYKAGRRRKQYVPREQVAAAAAGIARRRALRPPAWTMRQELAELRRMEKEVLG